MRTITKEQLEDILEKHKKWLNDDEGGERAIMTDADMRGADMTDAIMTGAIMSGAIMRGARNLFIPIACPEDGEFIGFKKCRDNYIVRLKITADAMRSSSTSRKCRCSKAEVLSITTVDGKDDGTTEAVSQHDKNFVYRVGETVEVTEFDENRFNECTPGIHFFITREEAVRY